MEKINQWHSKEIYQSWSQQFAKKLACYHKWKAHSVKSGRSVDLTTNVDQELNVDGSYPANLGLLGLTGTIQYENDVLFAILVMTSVRD